MWPLMAPPNPPATTVRPLSTILYTWFHFRRSSTRISVCSVHAGAYTWPLQQLATRRHVILHFRYVARSQYRNLQTRISWTNLLAATTWTIFAESRVRRKFVCVIRVHQLIREDPFFSHKKKKYVLVHSQTHGPGSFCQSSATYRRSFQNSTT